MIKKAALLFASIILLASTLSAQTVVGKYAGEFLALGVGGRALGMGGTHTAFVNDVTAGYWNPAGLARIEYPQVMLMHEEHFGDLVNYNYAAVAIPYGTDMSFGLSIIRLGVDGIPDTRDALYDANGDGILDINSDQLDYSLISEFSDTDWAFYLTFAKRHSEKFSWGANVKFIFRDLAEESATGIGFDIGATYQPVRNLYLGANIQDVTTTLVAWTTGRNELITPTIKFGAAYALHMLGGSVMPAVDMDMRFEGRDYASQFNVGPVSVDAHFGLEYSYDDLFAVRAGYNDVKQFTIGAGITLPKLQIDYSFARFNEAESDRLPDTHRISLMLNLNVPKYLRQQI